MIPRHRILRRSPAIRALVRETTIDPSDLIVPVFVEDGQGSITPIPAMQGYYRYSPDVLLDEVGILWSMGLRTILLFCKCPDNLKDDRGTEAYNPDGLMQRVISQVKSSHPEMTVMTDVALDPYTTSGHDGVVINGDVVNDYTVELLANMALTHARAGCDFVAPSDMMDGRVQAIRERFESEGYHNTGIMSYSAKYASCFYSPFRTALDSAPAFGDKKTYQMDPANRLEAVKEALADEAEGADIVMVKPAMAYLDVIREIRDSVSIPVSAYHVSGEYAMIRAAAAAGYVDEDHAILESTIAIRRAGADIIATYFAKDIVRLLDTQP